MVAEVTLEGTVEADSGMEDPMDRIDEHLEEDMVKKLVDSGRPVEDERLVKLLKYKSRS